MTTQDEAMYLLTQHQAIEITELKANNAKLRWALLHCKPSTRNVDTIIAWDTIEKALASTPAQSLAEYRNRVIDECANVAYELEHLHNRFDIAGCDDAIRKLKGEK